LHIFDRFKRFGNGDNESYGLGLPIVKTIANFHNIHIEIDSATNQGSNFKLLFNNV
jgi:two-component system sensor histidine kinase ArlS